MTLRNVPKGYTLEQQRQEINLVAADLNTAIDGVQTFGGNKEFTGDVTFSSNVYPSNVYLADNSIIHFGDDNDLKIYFDPSTGGGHIEAPVDLKLQTGRLIVNDAANTAVQLIANQNGSVELYYNAVKKFETSSTGVTISGDLDLNGDIDVQDFVTLCSTSGNVVVGSLNNPDANISIYAGTSTGLTNYFQFRASSNEAYITNNTGSGSGGGINIQARSSIGLYSDSHLTVWSKSTGEAALLYQTLEKLTTSATGISITGNIDTAVDALFTGDVEAASFVKTGGTSAEFLKADGTVDSNTYLITETDPVFSASEAASITSTDTTNWDTAYGWGDHSVEGYLTSYTETDPVVGAITGIVKADGAGNISAAVAGTDYATAAQGALADTALQSETITLATLKAEVAAATDFADFQSRIAAL
jgi:hypothetical protein